MGISATIGSAVIGAGGQIIGGSEQQSAAQSANNAQLQMYNQMRSDLMPYMQTGLGANTNLQNLTGTTLDANGNPTGNPLTSPLLQAPSMNLSESALEQTPGYQFNLSQGLKAVQNVAAARGLGSSGAALKGAASYATGLADNTYQNQFNNAVTNQDNQFNRLLGLTQLGQNSAAGVGASGIQTGKGVASNTIGAGTAGAASTIGAASQAGGIGQNYLLNNLTNGSLFGNNGPGSDLNNGASYALNNLGFGNLAYDNIQNSSGF